MQAILAVPAIKKALVSISPDVHHQSFRPPPFFFAIDYFELLPSSSPISFGHSSNEFQYSCHPSPEVKNLVSSSVITSTVPSAHSAITLSAPVIFSIRAAVREFDIARRISCPQSSKLVFETTMTRGMSPTAKGSHS